MLSPVIFWAQRKNVVLLTIALEDTRNQSIQLEPSSLKFSCDSKGKKYAVELTFLHEIDTETSRHVITDREIVFKLQKKDEEQPFWSKLTTDSKKPHYIKTDFNHWKDEDDSDYDEGSGPGGMGEMNLEDMMAKMGGAGGAGFDPGDVPESDDSDDEDIPELEG